jgi:thiol-disulfide isomerase/thioredoxin
MFLLGHGIPEHITNLPSTFLNSPYGRALMPEINKMVDRRFQKEGALLGLGSENTVPQKPDQLAFSVRKIESNRQLDLVLAEANKSSAVLFFTSPNCGPCKTLYGLYNQLAEESAHKVILVLVDVSRSYDIGSKYNIRSTPTFMSFLHGVEQERWSGADPAKLQGNIRMLAQMAFPPHSHESLNLPALRNSNTHPVLFSKVPPLGKLKVKMGAMAENGAVSDVLNFVSIRAEKGPSEATLPEMEPFCVFLRSAPSKLPTEIMFTIVDLLRLALVDSRFSGYFAEEANHQTIAPLISYVNTLQDCPYPLRLVTLQMCCNLFSSPLYPPHILTCSALSSPIISLITTSLLDSKHHNIRVAAASLAFNMTTSNSKLRREEGREGIPDSDQIELAACLLEAISVEDQSPEALKGFLLAFGYLVYCAPADGDLVDLLKSMDAQGTVSGKKKLFPDESLIQDIGDTLLGQGLK